MAASDFDLIECDWFARNTKSLFAEEFAVSLAPDLSCLLWQSSGVAMLVGSMLVEIQTTRFA